jgi:4'-phosphopantetheinyl transferase
LGIGNSILGANIGTFMTLSKFPHTICRALTISRGESQLSAALAVASDDQAADLTELAAEILGPEETAYFSTLQFARRQRSYLLGRYAAKLALRELFRESDLRAIEIARGVFDQPIVLSARKPGWGITISHADSIAAALAFPAGHPMGIDVELIDSTHYQTLRSQLSADEVTRLMGTEGQELELATAIWTAKEALSKVLCSGLMSPIPIYSLSEFRLIGPGIWEALFQNFAQYKATIWIGDRWVLSIVLPKRSTLGDGWDLRLNLIMSNFGSAAGVRTSIPEASR